jgi:hypothetical protein
MVVQLGAVQLRIWGGRNFGRSRGGGRLLFVQALRERGPTEISLLLRTRNAMDGEIRGQTLASPAEQQRSGSSAC